MSASSFISANIAARCLSQNLVIAACSVLTDQSNVRLPNSKSHVVSLIEQRFFSEILFSK